MQAMTVRQARGAGRADPVWKSIAASAKESEKENGGNEQT